MEHHRRVEWAGLFFAAGVFAIAPVACAQHARMGSFNAGASFRGAGSMTAFRAPAGSVRVRTNSLRATGAGRAPAAGSPQTPTADDFILNGTLDPYLNSGGVPLYISGILNAGPGSAYYGNNNLLGVKAFIDPATQMELATYERLQRNLQSTGIYLPLLPMYAAVPDDEGEAAADNGQDQGQIPPAPPQQPQVIIVQEQPQPAAENAEPPENSSAEPQAPLPDEGEFLLIFRDGSSETAAAFTKSGDQVVYITPEGNRESVPLSELDVQETQKVNQERGTPLQLSSD
ncbi:MAG TPA: hypothetical protein VMJ93_02045 [Verrucomicrobiae bacterium]|nr:hypothetical protein [Verrucomicrobiae bacterium]